MEKVKLIKKIQISTTLELLTGLHIGDNKESGEIGGVDNPVVRRRDNQQPYIPGSSLKGKMRCLLEQIAGAKKIGGNDKINDIFGIADGNDCKPSKIIVRDAYLTEKSAKDLKKSQFTDMPYTEIKFENSIDRIRGKAEHPRQQERVPAGSLFTVNFVINVWDTDHDGETSLEMLEKGIEALEKDYIGGSGSRGYGQVRFGELTIETISFENYFSA